MKKIIVIGGPTGVGKTALSIKLAKELNGEIINADSTQVYKGLDIGTSKVTQDEMEDIPHHLLSFVDLTDNYSVYDFQKDGRKIIDEILNRGNTPIIVGGSGLYLKALLYDYEFKDEDSKIDYELYTLEELYNKLKELDPETDIPKNNRRRVERALTFYNENGYPISMKSGKDNLLYDTVIVGLTCDRELLYRRIRQKTELMIEQGLISEARAIYDKKDVSRAIASVIGYRELFNYFDGNVSLEEAIKEIKDNSTNYAKRQYTWFNNQIDIKWFDIMGNNYNVEIIKYIKKELTS